MEYREGIHLKTEIYYASGTGNSLAVAKTLARELNGTYNSMMSSHQKERQRIDGERLGLVFPVQFLSLPQTVQLFLDRLEFNSQPRIFAVATCNGVPGHSLYTVDRFLKHKGQRMNLGFAVDMPGNILMNSEEVQSKRLNNSMKRIAQIVSMVEGGHEGHIEGDNSLVIHWKSRILAGLAHFMAPPSRRFYKEDPCNQCGVCSRVCPLGNITQSESGPVWAENCDFCMACYHWCPRNAVALKGQREKLKPYHHPEIGLDDIAHHR